jgi:hypothetical protein
MREILLPKDGRKVKGGEGMTVPEQAQGVGIFIPTRITMRIWNPTELAGSARNAGTANNVFLFARQRHCKQLLS